VAADDDLAASVRDALADAGAIREVKMFGGIGLMLNGNLVAGAGNIIAKRSRGRERGQW
jgi:TfoX/Sxy family transcriptional regulator of competence genes